MNTSQTAFLEHNTNTGGIPNETYLCDLFQRSMKLSAVNTIGNNAHDVLMYESPSYSTTPEPLVTSSSNTPADNESYGCEYLRTIRHQMDNYVTTNGEYLEAIFTHREIFMSYPSAHHQCARGFSDIAFMLERRAWRSDRDADTEAVTAFRHEAWSIAATMPSTSMQVPPFNGLASHVCLAPAM